MVNFRRTSYWVPFNRTAMVGWAIIIAVVVLLMGQARHDVPSKRTDILVIVLDDIANDRLSVYGESMLPPAAMPVTPWLDHVAACGMRFNRFYSAVTCAPTRACLLTGLVPENSTVGGTPMGTHKMPDHQNIGRFFSDAGWESIFIGKWHVDPVPFEPSVYDPLAPNLRGFDHFAGVPGNAGEYWDWDFVVDGVEGTSTNYRPADFLDFARKFWHADRRKNNGDPVPRLMVYASSLPHKPLHDPPPGWTTHPPGPDPLSQWVTMIEALDFEVGQLLQLVGPEDWVFVVSDNGDLRPCTTYSDWPECKGTLKEPGINVPLLVYGPGVAGGSVSEDLVAVYDIFPTLAEVAHLAPPNVDGRGFADILRGARRFPRESVISHSYAPQGVTPRTRDEIALVRPSFKLIRDRVTGIEELFSLDGSGWDGDPITNPLVLSSMVAELDAIESGW